MSNQINWLAQFLLSQFCDQIIFVAPCVIKSDQNVQFQNELIAAQG